MTIFIKIFIHIFNILFNSIQKGLNLFNPCLHSKMFRVVNDIEGKRRAKGNLWAILVLYEKAEIPFYVKNIIRVLSNLNINILISINDSVSPEALKYLEDNCYKLIVRKNFGRDFSAYKDALTYLDLKKIDKLILLNTSIIYFKKNLQKTIARFISNEYDVISLFKSYSPKAHYQSFLISLSNKVLTDKKFINFWKSYLPFNNRKHSIVNGEIKLSSDVLNFYNNYFVVHKFYVSDDFDSLKDLDIKLFIKLLPDSEKLLFSKSLPYISKIDYVSNVFFDNPSHKYAFLSYFKDKSLILKKDIYVRGTFSIPSISNNLKQLGIDKREAELLIQMLLSQQHYKQMNVFDRFFTILGLR
jgi:hypothetical protein